MRPKERGERSQGAIIGQLSKCGIPVLIPLGDNLRYDLVIERSGKFLTVQCKTGRIDVGTEREVLTFNACSQHCLTGKKRTYRGEVDLFAVYFPPLDEVYLVPVGEVGNIKGRLRLAPRADGKAAKLASAYSLRNLDV